MQTNKPENANEHLANERTFLAWVRTNIGVMAFGFVVVKFSLFMKQISLILDKQTILGNRGFSVAIGIALVAGGGICLILSFIHYKRTKKQIENSEFRSSALLVTVLTVFILLACMLLIAYLISSL